MVYGCTYSRPGAGAQRAANEAVAQTVFVLFEFDTANVLLLNGFFACGFLVRDRRVGDIHERSRMFLRRGRNSALKWNACQDGINLLMGGSVGTL